MDLFDVCMVLCDALIDDDGDIRNNAAKTVPTIFPLDSTTETISPGKRLSLMPSVALDKMFSFLAAHYKDSRLLFLEGFSRITRARTADMAEENKDTTDDPCLSSTLRLKWRVVSVKEMLNLVMMPDTSLFVEEKQNLFVDDVQDAQNWARALRKLQGNSIDEDTTSELHQWVAMGLHTLVENAQKEDSGALGWSFVPDVFAIGMRVLFAAEVLLDWTAKDYHQTDSEDIRRGLQSLAEATEERKLHPIWRKKVLELQSSRQIGPYDCELGTFHSLFTGTSALTIHFEALET